MHEATCLAPVLRCGLVQTANLFTLYGIVPATVGHQRCLRCSYFHGRARSAMLASAVRDAAVRLSIAAAFELATRAKTAIVSIHDRGKGARPSAGAGHTGNGPRRKMLLPLLRGAEGSVRGVGASRCRVRQIAENSADKGKESVRRRSVPLLGLPGAL